MYKRIVLIADKLGATERIWELSDNLELIEPDYFEDIYSSLSEISANVIHYNEPEEFLENISSHKKDIVLSIWSGRKSRNRKSLIPSICEAYNICYVGADPYMHFIAQDKNLAKHVCGKYGISSAKGVTINSIEEIGKINSLKYPLVVKPNFEGGSNGISMKNLVDNFEQAREITNILLETFKQTILVEEYIAGYEVNVTIVGVRGRIDIFEADQVIINGNDFFTRDLFSFESKKRDIQTSKSIKGTDLISDDLKKTFVDFFNSLGKVEIMRIDGRINNGEFKLLELSPDTYIGRRGSAFYAFEFAGYTYNEMIKKLLDNSIEFYKNK